MAKLGRCLKAVGALITLFLILPLFATVQGFSFSYGGNYPYNDLNDSPVITFSVENGSVLYNNPNLTLGLSAYIDTPQGLQTLMVTLTSISCKASWQDNQSIILYNSTIDTPAVLTYVPSGQGYFSYDFTNIPLGSQQLEVNVVGGGIIWGNNTYYTFYADSSRSLNFTVQIAPAQEPFPIALVAAIVMLIAMGVGLMVYSKKHKGRKQDYESRALSKFSVTASVLLGERFVLWGELKARQGKVY